MCRCLSRLMQTQCGCYVRTPACACIHAGGHACTEFAGTKDAGDGSCPGAEHTQVGCLHQGGCCTFILRAKHLLHETAYGNQCFLQAFFLTDAGELGRWAATHPEFTRGQLSSLAVAITSFKGLRRKEKTAFLTQFAACLL